MFNRSASILMVMALWAGQSMAEEIISKHKKTAVTLGGHDTVAYHDADNAADHRAEKGDEEFSVEWMGALWRFTNAENRDKFLLDPDRYRPAFGGYCANALSIGEGLVKTNGKTWEIFAGRLYVFYAPRGRKRWNDGNWKTYKADADNAWKKITGLE